MLGFLATLTSRLPEYPADCKAVTGRSWGRGWAEAQALRMKAVWSPSPPLSEKTAVPPLLSLWGLAYIEFSRQDRVLDITFMVIEVIKPELQGPDAVGR